MEEKSLSLFFLFFFCTLSFFISCSSASSPPLIIGRNTISELKNHTRISEFRVINRRFLQDCPDPNPYLGINVSLSSSSGLADDENVTVTVSGVLIPDKSDWIGMITPANSDISFCPLNTFYYKQTGDLSDLPLLCHYPVKAQYLSNDPSYLNCKSKECKESEDGECLVHTCSGSISFHVVNIRTEIEFVFFTGGFDTPCILKRAQPIGFSNPSSPLHAHLSSIDSTGTSMRVTWVSGDKSPQHVHYGGGSSATSKVSTFTNSDMCSGTLESPAKDFGWHDPGFIHSAVMTGLKPSQTYSYRYGSDSVGWSDQIKFKTPPAAGSDELRFLAYGDMGKAPLDPSLEHYIQPGSLSVVKAMADEVAAGNVDSVFHIGDISYATGFLAEWDFFLHLITPIASHVSYMTAIGNHERDYADSGSVYETPDSGGECGVAYETYFQMPTASKDKPWYSIEQASVHFTVMSTEHDWTENSEQYKWMKNDLASVDRSRTPWVIFAGHRPMYSSQEGILPSVDSDFVKAVEPLLLENKVDLVIFGHVHNYERTCAVFVANVKECPQKDADGIDTYDNSNYTARFKRLLEWQVDNSWSLKRISEFGYARLHATKDDLKLEDSTRLNLSQSAEAVLRHLEFGHYDTEDFEDGLSQDEDFQNWDLDDYPTLSAFASFISKFDSTTLNDGRSFCASMFRPVLEKFTPDVPTGPSGGRLRQEDAQEFLSFLMYEMHEELLKMRGCSSSSQQYVPSELTQIFWGQQKSVVRVEGNPDSADIVQPFLLLHLDIHPENIITMEEALQLFSASETIEGYKTISTGKVQADEVAASRSVKIQELPPILMLHMMRFGYGCNGTTKLNKTVSYPLELVVGDDLLADPTLDQGRHYELVATITHRGQGPSRGHYTADVKQSDRRWVRCDDASITTIGTNQVLGEEAYVLFYKQL
ncbi:hypothetical protein J5N97_009157 [Dioscorea zingiberensis]|uniref:Purple acid phosphatase n=1 Tax=Dioscorea zingiberensis TaxID=325984 RepID=A0A9D5CXN8_9LILI|nr:hypothetical protein J5N97_009157 [Dioscorea zingiberensis]